MSSSSSKSSSSSSSISSASSSSSTSPYIPSGGIEIKTNPFDQTHVDSTFFIRKEFLWNILGVVESSIDFYWDILEDEPTVWWWRIESEVDYLPNVFIDSGDPKIQAQQSIYVQYAAAPTLADLCNQLKGKMFARPILCWRIRSIKKYNKPLRSTSDKVYGEDINPWLTFEEQIGWETVPECMEFNLHTGQCAGQIIASPGEQCIPTIFNHPAGYICPEPKEDTIVPAVAPNVSGGMVIIYYEVFAYEAVPGPFIIEGTSPSIHCFGTSACVGSGIGVGGESLCACSYFEWENSDPPLLIGGESLVASSYWEMTGDGLLLISGDSLIVSPIWNWTPSSGNIIVGGNAPFILHYHMTPTGYVIMWGGAYSKEVTKNYLYTSDGSVILIEGTSSAYPSPYVAVPGPLVISGHSIAVSPSFHWP